MSDTKPRPIRLGDAPPRSKPSLYPSPFAERMAGRVKHPVGDLFGLSNFGVNLTRLEPGAVSALNHAHTRQDEFVLVLEGRLTLVCGDEEIEMGAGTCIGFKAGTGVGHHLENRGGQAATYLEVGDRSPGDTVSYPRDDLQAVMGEDGRWRFAHKDGRPY